MLTVSRGNVFAARKPYLVFHLTFVHTLTGIFCLNRTADVVPSWRLFASDVLASYLFFLPATRSLWISPLVLQDLGILNTKDILSILVACLEVVDWWIGGFFVDLGLLDVWSILGICFVARLVLGITDCLLPSH